MKTKTSLPITFICLIAFILSCENKTIDTAKGSRPIFVTAAIDGIQTRATDASWEKGDAIGVYMKKSGETLNAAPLSQNMKYVTTGTSLFSPESEAMEILFPFDGADADFIAYYPHRRTITDFVYPVNITNQSNPAAIDLLYSDNAIKLNSKNPNVKMLFSHQLSKIVLTINSTSAKLNLSGLAVKITNVGTTASFSLVNGELSVPTTMGDVFFRINKEGTSAEAILLPTDNLTDKKLVFMVGNTWFTYDLNKSATITSFAKSTKYTYTITLNPEIVKVEAEGNINDWINGPSDEAIIAQDPYDDKGTRNNPYTVEEAIAKQGKTNVWVKAVIRGYKSGSSYVFSADKAPATNIAIADNLEESDASKIIPVQLSSGKIRDAINLKDNPTMLQKTILLQGDLSEYLSVPGLLNVKGAIVDDVEHTLP